MSRYTGSVTQSILDYYAKSALSAQQWFSSADPAYWAFVLINNATDGTSLWVYDARASSQSANAYPAGTGNPGGNPNAQPGLAPGSGVATTWQLVSQSSNDSGSADTLVVPAPAALVPGNVLILGMFGTTLSAADFIPPDNTWLPGGAVSGNGASPGLASFAHIVTGSEPSNYTVGSNGVTCQLGARITQFSGSVQPALIDGALGQVSLVNGTQLVAPGVFSAFPNDLVYCQWCVQDGPFDSFSLPPGFTDLGFLDPANHSMHDGYIPGVPAGAIGPFTATNDTTPWSALTTVFRAGFPGIAPGQTLSQPVNPLQPVLPGLLTLNFSTNPLGLFGPTEWVPPDYPFTWDREAPIAVIPPGWNFNLAGISPSKAAWGSITWLALK